MGKWAICDSSISSATLLFHSCTGTFEACESRHRQHVALSQTHFMPLPLCSKQGRALMRAWLPVCTYALNLTRKGRKGQCQPPGCRMETEMFPNNRSNPCYYKTDILELFSGNEEPSLLMSHQKGILTYITKIHFIWERWRARSLLLGFEHVDQDHLGMSSLQYHAKLKFYAIQRQEEGAQKTLLHWHPGIPWKSSVLKALSSSF